jgi:hypothetical protein
MFMQPRFAGAVRALFLGLPLWLAVICLAFLGGCDATRAFFTGLPWWWYVCLVALVVLVIFFFWYRKRQV